MQVILESIASSSSQDKKKGLYRHVYTGHRATVEVTCFHSLAFGLYSSSLSSYGSSAGFEGRSSRGELLLPSELAQQLLRRRHRSSNDGGGEVFEDHEQDLSREHPRISSTTYYSPTALLV